MTKSLPKTITVECTFTLTQEQYTQLLQNSIERVLNNAIEIGGWGETGVVPRSVREDASILWQDCTELKPLVCQIWTRVQEDVRVVLSRR